MSVSPCAGQRLHRRLLMDRCAGTISRAGGPTMHDGTKPDLTISMPKRHAFILAAGLLALPMAGAQQHSSTGGSAAGNPSMQPSGNVDRDFAMMMRNHHKQGIDRG